MSEYPLPRYAAYIWIAGDEIILAFPDVVNHPAPASTVKFPNNPKGLALALAILNERNKSSNVIGSIGAPVQYSIERALVNDRKYNEWLKAMQAANEVTAAEKAEATAFLEELGL